LHAENGTRNVTRLLCFVGPFPGNFRWCDGYWARHTVCFAPKRDAQVRQLLHGINFLHIYTFARLDGWSRGWVESVSRVCSHPAARAAASLTRSIRTHRRRLSFLPPPHCPRETEPCFRPSPRARCQTLWSEKPLAAPSRRLSGGGVRGGGTVGLLWPRGDDPASVMARKVLSLLDAGVYVLRRCLQQCAPFYSCFQRCPPAADYYFLQSPANRR